MRSAFALARFVRCCGVAVPGVGALIWPAVAMAQLPSLAETSAQYLPSSEVPGGGGLRAQVTSYDAALNVPIVLGDATFLVPGAQYHVDSVSYAHAPGGFTPLNALHALDFPILLAHVLSKQWSVSLRVWPGAASDFERFDGRALHVGALAMVAWSPHARLTLGGGPTASYAFGQLFPLPFVYIDWQPAPWFRVEASLPFFASAILSPSDRFELGLQADVNGNEYSIRKSSISDRYPCRAQAVDDPTTAVNETRAAPEGCLDHLAYSVVAAGALARVRIVSLLWLGGFFGYTLFRRYDLKNPTGGSMPRGQTVLPNELALRVGLVLRLPLPEEPKPAPH